jgi:NitT/TauT family transport system substrate-binding protein
MHSLLRRALAAFSLLVALSVVPVSAAENAPLTVIRRGVMSQTAVDWSYFVAQSEGFFAREGLDVQQTLIDPPTTVTALIGGSLDVVVIDSTGFVLGVDRGANITAVGPVADRNPYHLMATPDVTSVAQLKGKKIAAASPIEIYTFVIRSILKKAGLDPDKDVEWVFGGGQNQRLSAILGGAVSAGLFSSPADEKLRERGLTSLAFTPDVVPSLALSVTAVRKEWAQQNAGALRKYLKAQADAVAWLNVPANKPRAIAILASATNTTPAEAATAYDYWVGRKVLTDTCAVASRFDTLLTLLKEQGRLTSLTPGDARKLVDTEYCSK